MEKNPILKKLGFSHTDRLVIIHTDDVGMCHASLSAYTDLVDFGLISSAATMVPCSWFPSVAKFCQKNPAIDMGVHLTITSEWDTYRWSPISTRDHNSGLIDDEGYFYHSSENAQLFGDSESVQLELQTQLNRCVSAGIEVSHLDTHMNTVAHPKFIAGYIQLAVQHKLPFLFPRLDSAGYQKLGMDEEIATIAASYVNILEEQGIPLVDYASGLNLIDNTNRLEQAKQLLINLPIGITHFIIHPAIDTPELRAIAPDWQCRVADYRTFMDEKLRKFIHNSGLQVIGYRSLKEIMQ